jgi:hypothetical protein
MHGMYVNAGSLYKNAVEVYRETSASMPIQARRSSLISIILATISTEAFINELHHLAHNQSDASAAGWVNALSEILNEAEKSRASIESKYQLAKFILTGQPFDRGSSPFQQFSLLVDLRNLIVHVRPQQALLKNDNGRYVWVSPPIMTRLQAAGIISVDDYIKQAASQNNAEGVIADVLAQVSTEAVAGWACITAATIVNAILDALPQSLFKVGADIAYRKDFSAALQGPKT